MCTANCSYITLCMLCHSELSLTIQYDCYILYDLYRVVQLIFTMIAFYIVFFDFNAFNYISMSYIYIMMFRLNECNIFKIVL